jgi:hypothetical protein
MSIYIIRHKESDNCYIGSTEDIKARERTHKSALKRGVNLKIYRFMRDNGGWDNFDMVEICKCDIDMLREMEQYHKDFINPSLNSQNVIQDKEKVKQQIKKHYYNNREKRLEQVRQYNKNNKDIINAKRSVVIECECGVSHTKRHKARHLKSNYHLSRCPPLPPHSHRQT